MINRILFFLRRKVSSIYWNLLGFKFTSVGVYFKCRGSTLSIGSNVSVGDFCWIEAVSKYQSQRFNPLIEIGDEVAMGDFVHITSISSISIGSGTLIGSKVYIGDHSHGNYRDVILWKRERDMMPKHRPLSDDKAIIIGKNCWIGDGVVILAGAIIGSNCVIGANSVVKDRFESDLIIGGVPARVIKKLTDE